MADGTSLINIGELSKPATVLVEKVCSAVGIVFEPTRIVRKANADAKAEIIKAKANIEIRDIEQRAIDRFIHQETRKQENIESITFQAAKTLPPDAKVESLDEDWVAYFFKHCETVSDQEMQSLWSRLLSGEAANPGTFSIRTVQFISAIDKKDAELFSKFCQFVWEIDGLTPLILHHESKYYSDKGVSFESLLHLETLGLITYSQMSYFGINELPKNVVVRYFNKSVNIIFKSNAGNNTLQTGVALLTNMGAELYQIAGTVFNQEFYTFILSEWQKSNESFDVLEIQ
jgi:hypothetical protein